MSIQSIIRWFEIAKPEPTKKDVLTQIGCHFEEVQEFILATTHAKAQAYADEVGELTDFYKAGNVLNTLDTADDVALLDALCDQVVTAVGVAYMMGMDIEGALAEVNRSNWTKFNADGTPYIHPDGKIGKNPETYQEPQLADYISLADRQQRTKDRYREESYDPLQHEFPCEASQVSDGYHTFEELYNHRMILFSIICNSYPSRAWKSKLHHDGTMYDNYFIVGINTPEGCFTYHYHLNHWDKFQVRELPNAPEWDGHTSDDIERLYSLL